VDILEGDRGIMFKAFCYCCKEHVETLDEKEFRKAGHVSDKDEAKSKYGVNASQLKRDVK
jgi:hypothetical protein